MIRPSAFKETRAGRKYYIVIVCDAYYLQYYNSKYSLQNCLICKQRIRISKTESREGQSTVAKRKEHTWKISAGTNSPVEQTTDINEIYIFNIKEPGVLTIYLYLTPISEFLLYLFLVYLEPGHLNLRSD